MFSDELFNCLLRSCLVTVTSDKDIIAQWINLLWKFTREQKLARMPKRHLSQSHPCSVMNLYHSIVLRGLVWQHKDVKIIAQWINLLWKLAPLPKQSLSQSHRVGRRCTHGGSDYCSPSLGFDLSWTPSSSSVALTLDWTSVVEPPWCLTIGSSVENPPLWEQQRRDGPNLRGNKVWWNRVYSSTKSSIPFDQTIVCHLGY